MFGRDLLEASETAASTITAAECLLAGVLDTDPDSIQWGFTFADRDLIGVADPPDNLLEVTITGQLTEPVPEWYATEGQVQTPLFFNTENNQYTNISAEETTNHAETLARQIVEVRPLDEVAPTTDTVLKELAEQGKNGIIDSLGTPWNKRDSILAAEVAEQSEATTDPDVVVSFDLLRALSEVYQYADYLVFENHDTGKGGKHYERVQCDRRSDIQYLSMEALPVATELYVYQENRTSAADYEISPDDIRSTIQGRIVRLRGRCTIPDPGEQHIRAQVGQVYSIRDNEIEPYHGVVRAATDADISRLYDFHAALRVPSVPYITHQIAQETADWGSLHSSSENDRYFQAWHSAGSGFSLKRKNRQRDIYQFLTVKDYWILHGQRYYRKDDFEADVEQLREAIE